MSIRPLSDDFPRDPEEDRRTYACSLAACLRVVHLLDDERSRVALGVLERLADGLAGDDEMAEAARGAIVAFKEADAIDPNAATTFAAEAVARAVAWSVAGESDMLDFDWEYHRNRDFPGWLIMLGCLDSINVSAMALAEVLHPGAGRENWKSTRPTPGEMMDDVFGPKSVVPASPDPRWLSTDVVELARAIHRSSDFDALPILADALEEAGCDRPEILGHCRGPGPHVRGCWVVASILRGGRP